MRESVDQGNDVSLPRACVLVCVCKPQPYPNACSCPTQDRPATSSFVSGCGPDEFYSALVGDAAHPTRPSLGQGANMALEDAVQLALSLHETGSVIFFFRVHRGDDL